MMSRGSRRHRARQIEAVAARRVEDQQIHGGTRQIGALRVSPDRQAISIDASKLEAPTLGFDADWGSIEYSTGRVSLVFGKHSRERAETLQSRFEIRYAPERLITTFWKNSEAFFELVDGYVKSWPEEARPVSEPPAHWPAERAHSEWASFTFMSFSGTEAALDFYHIAPAGIAMYTRTGNASGLRLNPVARVQMTTFELLALAERVRPVVLRILETLPARHKPDVEDAEEEAAQ